MLGYIEFEEGGGNARLAQEKRLGGTFLVLDMGRGARGLLSGRRAVRAALQMRQQGVRRAVFPVDFPHTAIFLRSGISPVDPLPLRKALCVPFVRNQLEALGLSETQAVIAIAGEHMTSELAEITRTLAISYRYVMLSVRSGGEAFARELRRQYGISLLLNPSPDQLDRSDALVLLAPRSGLKQENPILCSLYPGNSGRGQLPLRLGSDLAGQVAPNCSEEQLAAALYSMGLLSSGQLLREITC